MIGKKVSIVIEETGEHGGKGFNVYMEGLSQEASNMTTQEQMDKLSPADFWGLRLFQICTGILKETGVIHEVKKFN